MILETKNDYACDRAGNMGYAVQDYYAGTTEESRSYSYDAAGCMTNLNGVALEWDERYRLKSVKSAQSVDVSYAYDVLDRRVSRLEIPPEGGTTNLVHFIYDGNQIVADLDGSGNLLRTYVWDVGIDNLLSFTDHTTSNTYYAIKDHQNSIIALADDMGTIVETYDYDAYGNTKVFDENQIEIQKSEIDTPSKAGSMMLRPGSTTSAPAGTTPKPVAGSPRSGRFEKSVRLANHRTPEFIG